MPEEYSFNESFQKKLLSLYVRYPQAVFGIIEPAYFTNPVYVDIARLTHDIYEEHSKSEVRLSRPTLVSIVKGFLGRKRAESYPAYRKVVREVFEDDLKDKKIAVQQAVEFARTQRFRKALLDSEKDINNRQFGRAIERFNGLRGFGSEADLGVEYWKNLKSPSRWYEDRQGVVGTFYMPTLDSAMGGGLGAGELGIVLAGGKAGKSSLLARFASGALWQGKNVAIATGELSAAKYRKRIDSMITNIPYWKLSQIGRLVDEDDRKLARALKRAQRRMGIARRQMRGSLWIKQWPTGKGKVGDIEVWLEQLRQNGTKVDILFVDYIRVFRPNESFEDQRQKIGQVTIDLRGLAQERNVPVWTAAQTNRAALSKERIGPEDMAEDISQFWTLDFLVALAQTKAEAGLKPEHARLYLTAARDVGRSDTIEILLDRDTFRIWEKKRKKV